MQFCIRIYIISKNIVAAVFFVWTMLGIIF